MHTKEEPEDKEYAQITRVCYTSTLPVTELQHVKNCVARRLQEIEREDALRASSFLPTHPHHGASSKQHTVELRLPLRYGRRYAGGFLERAQL